MSRTIQSGSHYLDVNSSNKDGLTPLLLVTKDVSLFSEGTYIMSHHSHHMYTCWQTTLVTCFSVQNAMETEYNPVEVLEELLANHA